MKLRLMAGFFVGATALVWAQQHPSQMNPVRALPPPVNALPFGNLLYPGGIPGRYPGLGGSLGTIYGGSVPYAGVRPGTPQRPPDRGGRGRTVVVPYAVPVYYGGYGYANGYGGGYYDPAQQSPTNVTVVVPQQPTPSVIINQTFPGAEGTRSEVRESASNEIPETGGIRVYEPGRRSEAPQPKNEKQVAQSPEPAKASAPARTRDDKPTIYLIALKDSTIRQAIGYWVKGDKLSYVTPQASVNHVSLDMVDREMSVQLNAERNLELDLKTQ